MGIGYVINVVLRHKFRFFNHVPIKNAEVWSKIFILTYLKEI